jgi:hypothetical protein
MHCHLMRDSLKNMSSITFYLIFSTKQGKFSKAFVGGFLEHTDNSMCHDGRKMTGELDILELDPVQHSPYSPDLSP